MFNFIRTTNDTLTISANVNINYNFKKLYGCHYVNIITVIFYILYFIKIITNYARAGKNGNDSENVIHLWSQPKQMFFTIA